jgi:hypothetical protein
MSNEVRRDVKRVLRYLKGTANMGIHFQANIHPELFAYVDADWAGDLRDRKSTSGNIIFFGGPISWASRKQTSVALSSTESEYVSMADLLQELMHCRRILTEIGVAEACVTVYGDSQSAIAIAKSENTKRSKHIDIKHHYIKDLLLHAVFTMHYVPSDSNVADIMTKPLASITFSKHRDMLLSPVQIEEGVKSRDLSDDAADTCTVRIPLSQ